MTWYQQLRLLQILQAGIPGKQLLTVPEEPAEEARLRHTFERLEAESSAAVDAAVRAFCRTGRLPDLEGAALYFLAQRLDHAVWLTMAVGACSDGEDIPALPDPPASFPKEAQLEWLLIWAWQLPGKAWWLEKAILNERLRRTR